MINVVGLITEYNPFHNGHAYHIQKAKELTGADFVIVLMSGDFVQRGSVAIYDKYLRTKMALACGADLVLELPLLSACSSAEFFARGSIHILDELQIVNSICFGCESPNPELFQEIAQILADEPEKYQYFLQDFLKRGQGYPLARQNALKKYLSFENKAILSDELDLLLSSPNNILGLEYCKALIRKKSIISPVMLTRQGNSYHSLDLNHTFSSATALREILTNATPDMLSDYRQFFPEPVFDFLTQYLLSQRGAITSEDFSLLFKYKLLSESAESITQYLDVSRDLAQRIYNQFSSFSSFSSFCLNLKTKEITQTRIQRALFHILLEISAYEVPSYVRILGFKKSSAALLHELKLHSNLPIITKLADWKKVIPFSQEDVFSREIMSANLYESAASTKYHFPFVHEFSKPLIIL